MKRIFGLILVMVFISASLFGGDLKTEFVKLQKSNPNAKITGKIGINSPILITGLSERVYADSIDRAAIEFIGRYPGLFSINDSIGVVVDRIVGSVGSKTVRLNYTYRGIPIYPAGIALTIDSNKTVNKVTFFNLPSLSLDTKVSFNEMDAYYLVLNRDVSGYKSIGARYNKDSVRKVILLMGNKAFLAYEVKIASFATLTNMSYFVDARSGKLLFKKNNVFNLNKAKVYDPNPGVDGKGELVEVDITNLDPNVTDKTLTGTLIRSMNCYGKGDQKEWQLYQYQTTVRYYTCNVGPKAKSDDNGDFYITPDDPTKCFAPEDSQACFESVMEDDFAEIMMYYHANKMYTYYKGKGFDVIKTNSGLPSLMTVVNFKLPNFYEMRSNCEPDPNNEGWQICTINSFMPFDNAAFMPYDGSFDDFNIHDDAIVFGQGEKVDFSYDAEVTYHEFTHAMIGSTSNLGYAYVDSYGLYIDPGAMNEGLADYFSSTVSGDPKLGEYVSNATEDQGALRDLSINMRCPDDLWGESHNDGLILSNALWKIRMEFLKDFGSVDLFDQKVYNTVIALSEVATFSDFSNGLLEELRKDNNIGQTFADKAELIFKDNNILNCERYMPLENGKLIMLIEGLDIIGLSPYAPGYLQFTYDIPANATKFMLDMDIYSNSMMGGSDAEIRVLMKKNTPVEFEFSYNGDVTSNADFEITTDNNSHFEVSVPKFEPGNKYYIAFVNYGGAQGILQYITASVETGVIDTDAGVDTLQDTSTSDIVSDDTAISEDVIDASQDDAGVNDVVIVDDVGSTDVGSDANNTKDAISSDTSTNLDVVVIDGSSSSSSKDESGCSCSLIE